MPSTTFLRLPQEKQTIIKEAAIKEFSMNAFEDAKITRICDYASIPRRTFYSYFESLEDLYRYIFSELEKRCRKRLWTDDLQLEKYFMNLIASEEGLRELYLLIEAEDEDIQDVCHIAISISIKRKLNLMSKEVYEEKIHSLFNNIHF